MTQWEAIIEKFDLVIKQGRKKDMSEIAFRKSLKELIRGGLSTSM